jgi:hypothetical protein
MGHDARCSAETSAKWQNKVTIVVAEEAIRRALTLLKCSKITLTKLSFLTAMGSKSARGKIFNRLHLPRGAFQSQAVYGVLENDQSEPHPMPEWLPESRPGRLHHYH